MPLQSRLQGEPPTSLTDEIDRLAFLYLSPPLLLAVVGYSGYSLYTGYYKSWYSWLIETLVASVYGGGAAARGGGAAAAGGKKGKNGKGTPRGTPRALLGLAEAIFGTAPASAPAPAPAPASARASAGTSARGPAAAPTGTSGARGSGADGSSASEWLTRWVEVRAATGSEGPRLLVYPSISSFEALYTLQLEGAQISTADGAQIEHAWQISAPGAVSSGGGGSDRSGGEGRGGGSGDGEPTLTCVFAAGDSADAERWVGACRQQAGFSTDVMEDLTPRISAELKLGGFLEAEQRATIIAPTELVLGRQLGTGFYGAVYEGTWRGAKVALKFCSQDATPDMVQEWRVQLVRESALHHTLSHSNVIKWHGICIGLAPKSWPDGLQPPCACVELAEQTFLQLLKQTPRGSLYLVSYWLVACRILEEACHGLAYLHSERIMHRDFKAENLLLDEFSQVKISDFGLSKAHKKSESLRQTGIAGAWSHHAPEVLNGEYGLSADIFSFGIVICEALTATEAQDMVEETRTAAFGLNVDGLLSFLDRQHHHSACFDLVGLAADCCQLDPMARPSVTDCLERLETIRGDFLAWELECLEA